MDIVVVGSCVQDLVSYTPRFPKPGESVRGHKFATGFGGKGANQAIQAARLGARVEMVARVGNDIFGPPTIQNFKDHGIAVEHCKCIDDAGTATATITVSETGENNIVVVLGANEHLKPANVTDAAASIKRAKVLLCQLEIPQESVLEAFKIAKNNGVRVVFNPAPGLPDLNRELLQYADIVCPNENEAEILTGQHITTVDEAKEAAVKIRQICAPNCVVIITLGPNGCVLLEPGSETSAKHVPTDKVTATDTTGAGDSFVGSLAYFLSKRPDLNLEQAIDRSLRIASISVQYPGTQASYLPKDKLPQDLFR